MPEVCANCRFWHTNQNVEQPFLGNCRRHAPLKVDNSVDQQWPKTREYDWCGEFQPKELTTA